TNYMTFSIRPRRFRLTLIALFATILFSACGSGGSNVSADAPADLQLKVWELEEFDKEARKADIGKIGETIGMVISSKVVAKNETEFGSHFIYVKGEIGPNKKFTPTISCYTWGYPELKEGDMVRLKGKIGKGAAMGFSLMDCHVEKLQ
ncbi:MAG: hypothetical protein AAF570_25270, partial [Bacteroidota bacterium]